MALELPFGIRVTNPVYTDEWEGPFYGDNETEALAVANAGIPAGIRVKGKFAKLIIAGSANLYWYKDNTTDGGLVLFEAGVSDAATSIELHLTETGASVIDLIESASSNHYCGIDTTGSDLDSLTVNSYPDPADGAELWITVNKPVTGSFNLLNAFLGTGVSEPSTYFLRYSQTGSTWIGVQRMPITMSPGGTQDLQSVLGEGHTAEDELIELTSSSDPNFVTIDAYGVNVNNGAGQQSNLDAEGLDIRQSSNRARIQSDSIDSNRTHMLQNKSGTLAHLDDIPSPTGTPDLQEVTDEGAETTNPIKVTDGDTPTAETEITPGTVHIRSVVDSKSINISPEDATYQTDSTSNKINFTNTTGDRTHNLQDRDGDLAHLDQVIGGGINNLNASAAPTNSDDITHGYVNGEHASVWFYDGTFYVCVDNTEGAAVWEPVGSSGGGLITTTYSDASTLISNNELIPGQFYHITDAGGTDKGVILQAVTPNQFSLEGKGGFLNPDFQQVGNYEGVEGITSVAYNSTQGVWYAGGEVGYSNGDVVFWNGVHYQLTNSGAVNGNDPLTNPSAYTGLPKNVEKVGYIEEWDLINYNIGLNDIVYWSDKRMNIIIGNTTGFQRGNNFVLGNYVEGRVGGVLYCINNKGSIVNNRVGGELYCINNKGHIVNNNVLSSAALNTDTTHTPKPFDIPETTSNLGIIEACVVSGYSRVALSLPADHSVYGAEISGASYIEISKLKNDFSIGSEGSSIYSSAQGSTAIASVDITGVDYIDMEMLNSYGIIELEGAPIGNIRSFINLAAHYIPFHNRNIPFEVRPIGTVVTIESTAFDSIDDDGLIIGSAATWPVDGTKGESIQFRGESITNTNGTFYVMRVIGGNNGTL